MEDTLVKLQKIFLKNVRLAFKKLVTTYIMNLSVSFFGSFID